MAELSPAEFFALGNAAAAQTAEWRLRLAREGVGSTEAADDSPSDTDPRD